MEVAPRRPAVTLEQAVSVGVGGGDGSNDRTE